MRSFLAVCSFGLALLALPGCAPVPHTGGTVADPTLHADVMQMIGKLEAALGRSKQPTFVSARRLGQRQGTVTELWIVDNGGTRPTYAVALTPSPGGGVDYKVRLWSGPIAVTLRDGKTYEVETFRGLPKNHSSSDIRVRGLGIAAAFTRDHTDAPPFEWALEAALLAKGQFEVTITTPLDSSASEHLSAYTSTITLHFFPRSKYPRIWEGIDQPGVHWFPFHFVFEEKQSSKRFEFTQWAQIDYETWRESRDMVEKMKEKMKRDRPER